MKPYLFFLFVISGLDLSAQEPISIHHGCNFEGDENETEYYTFEPSSEADKIVKRILDAAGSLSYKSFIVKESNVKNALATTEGKDRYILYSTAFLEKFKGDAQTRWAAYTVLAHEIGHHLNNHDFSEKDPKKRKSMELEADKFAGAVCRTLGATLQEALAGMESMPLDGESSTHPAKSARTAAIANGWKKQDEILGGQHPESPAITDRMPPSPEKGKTETQPTDFSAVSKALRAQNQTTQITIAYTGDLYSCGLQLSLNIGGVSFVPLSNSYLASNIPVGAQSYTVSGTIACPTLGSCTVIGNGQINVVPGGTYLIQWSNTAYAQCTVQLIANQ